MTNLELDLTYKNLELQQDLNKILDILPINIDIIDSDNPLMLNNIDDVVEFLQTIKDL